MPFKPFTRLTVSNDQALTEEWYLPYITGKPKDFGAVPVPAIRIRFNETARGSGQPSLQFLNRNLEMGSGNPKDHDANRRTVREADLEVGWYTARKWPELTRSSNNAVRSEPRQSYSVSTLYGSCDRGEFTQGTNVNRRPPRLRPSELVGPRIWAAFYQESDPGFVSHD